MPDLGEIRETKRRDCTGHIKWIWHACVFCGKERWVPLFKGKPRSVRCKSCANRERKGERNANWKGGRRKVKQGYILRWLAQGDFFYPMAVAHYVKEHRLIMAQHLGRCLHLWEIVHHKNGIKDDNQIDNLQLITDDRHKQITTLEKRIAKLQLENKLLREKWLKER